MVASLSVTSKSSTKARTCSGPTDQEAIPNSGAPAPYFGRRDPHPSVDVVVLQCLREQTRGDGQPGDDDGELAAGDQGGAGAKPAGGGDPGAAGGPPAAGELGQRGHQRQRGCHQGDPGKLVRVGLQPEEHE